MPTAPTYPGVYVEEVPSGVHTITGVPTAVAVFIDLFKRGPMNEPVQLFSVADFERELGGLDRRSEGSYQIQQFFLNGGAEAWGVRCASPDSASKQPAKAEVAVLSAVSATPATATAALTVTAINEGDWGNDLRVRIDADPADSSLFNLTVAQVKVTNGRPVVLQQEVFRNLSMTSTSAQFVEARVNDRQTGSKLIRVKATGTARPLGNGTLSGEHTTDPTIATNSGFANQQLTLKVKVTIGNIAETEVTMKVSAATAGSNIPLTLLAAQLQAAIRQIAPANPAVMGTTVDVVGPSAHRRLRVLVGPGQPGWKVSFAKAGTDTTADNLKLTTDAAVNLQEYLVGTGAGTITAPDSGLAATAQGKGVAGYDGAPPGAAALLAALESLEKIDVFNLLSVPRTALVSPGCTDATLNPLSSSTEAASVMTRAIQICEERRAMFIMDPPFGYRTYRDIKDWLASNDSLRSPNAVLYYPRVQVADPLADFRTRSLGPSGTAAGVMARTDAERGVWKAPAGTEAVVRNVSELEDVLTDRQNGALNPLAINSLRQFPVYGKVVWGARTLAGADQAASEWKYVPVRRLALYLEETLFRGTKWVVFEPNDEPLWSQIRLNIGAFMHNLFRQGAFQGSTPREAYFVKCDRETTTQNDINQGVVNIVVGFAPLKPAEFVVIKFQQMTGQIES